MVILNNNIVNKIYSKWAALLDELKLQRSKDLNEVELRLAALLFEIYSGKHKTIDRLNSNVHIIIYRFIHNDSRKYKDIIDRIEYLNKLKSMYGDDFDFMFELENLLECFLEQFESCWCEFLQVDCKIKELNELDRVYIETNNFLISKFLKKFEKIEIEFN